MAVQKISKEKITSTANTEIWLQCKIKSVYTIRKNNWQAPRPSKQSTSFREQMAMQYVRAKNNKHFRISLYQILQSTLNYIVTRKQIPCTQTQ